MVLRWAWVHVCCWCSHTQLQNRPGRAEDAHTNSRAVHRHGKDGGIHLRRNLATSTHNHLQANLLPGSGAPR
jgi:hypothetical protein